MALQWGMRCQWWDRQWQTVTFDALACMHGDGDLLLLVTSFCAFLNLLFKKKLFLCFKFIY